MRSHWSGDAGKRTAPQHVSAALWGLGAVSGSSHHISRPEDSRGHGDELEQPPSSDKHGSKRNSHQKAQPELLSALGSPGGNNFARWGMREALSRGLERDSRCQRAGQPPYLYWVTAGLALAEQWNFTVLSSRTGCGSTDKFTRGGSAKRYRQAHERPEDTEHPLAHCLPGF